MCIRDRCAPIAVGLAKRVMDAAAKPALALVNRGGASTVELMALAREIAGRVQERFGVAISPEPVLVGHEW